MIAKRITLTAALLTGLFLTSLPAAPRVSAMAGNVEVQTEYLQHRAFPDRHIDDVNIHVFQKAHEQAGFTFHRGFTVTRAHGFTTEDAVYRKSNAWGIGPAVMVRYERPLSGKLTWDVEGSGSLLVYSKSFPAQGRPFGFMWRIGPRLNYHYTKDNSASLGYIFSHSSNGFSTDNPGHNSIGFSLGFDHKF